MTDKELVARYQMALEAIIEAPDFVIRGNIARQALKVKPTQ